ncbi:zinc finger MYM-type protein 1-like [Zophobas morio]|uniref:zinc finger MYM-type protein 1-like n=1 Tax=Zophobas morio TaxID=2755281 RepID=UPI003082F616
MDIRKYFAPDTNVKRLKLAPDQDNVQQEVQEHKEGLPSTSYSTIKLENVGMGSNSNYSDTYNDMGHYLDVTSHTNELNLPLRGKTNKIAIFNRLLQFRVEAGDEELKEHFSNRPKNATCISHRVQNEIILRNKIIENAGLTKDVLLSILADETIDISGTKQLSLAVRYVNTNFNKVHHEFLGFTALSQLDAEYTAEKILTTLSSWNLKLQNMVGQGYDGCSVMTGKIRGVQKTINNKYSIALFYHCTSHRLNLVINDLNHLPEIRNSTGTVNEIIKFFRENGQRTQVVRTRLRKLCETQWTEKYKAIRKFGENFMDMADALSKLSSEESIDNDLLKTNEYIQDLIQILNELISLEKDSPDQLKK